MFQTIYIKDMKGNVTPHYYLGLSWWLLIKNLPAMGETQVWSLGWKDPLEKGKASHSRVLAWRIPRIEESGGLSTMGSQRIRHKWATNPFTWLPWVAQVVKTLPATQGIHLCSIPGSGRSPGEGNGYPLQYSCLEMPWTEQPGRLHSPWGRKELDTTEWLSLHFTCQTKKKKQKAGFVVLVKGQTKQKN